jgi:hypothetical protein
MARAEKRKSRRDDSTTKNSVSGRAKLDRLKAEVFSAESKSERVTQALAALKKAIKEPRLDLETIKIIAQDKDLEGF